jgi:hypothetical protein
LASVEVGDALTKLLLILPADNERIKFADYVLDTYIHENSEYPLIRGHHQIFDYPRTTNRPESFYSNFNKQFYTPHSHVYFIAVLLEIQTENKIKVNSISKNIPNVQRKETIKNKEFTQETWNKYKKRILTN